jgi:hypothetical protein
MFVLKGCPRCGGDLFSGIDDEFTCIQCGKDVAAGMVPSLKGSAAERRRPAPVTA